MKRVRDESDNGQTLRFRAWARVWVRVSQVWDELQHPDAQALSPAGQHWYLVGMNATPGVFPTATQLSPAVAPQHLPPQYAPSASGPAHPRTGSFSGPMHRSGARRNQIASVDTRWPPRCPQHRIMVCRVMKYLPACMQSVGPHKSLQAVY